MATIGDLGLARKFDLDTLTLVVIAKKPGHHQRGLTLWCLNKMMKITT